MAAHCQKGFLPLRKAGKLPPPVIQQSYELEYGKATLELAPAPTGTAHTSRVIICDDVLATGGTLNAAIQLCEKAGYQVSDVLVLINLTFLNSMKFKNEPVKSLIQY
jgi:adenine phosphoribosyltransferase